MEISQHKAGDLLIIRLTGRLDATWCDPVEKALTTAVRSGEHRIHLDMSGVDYMSSAGLRVIFFIYKQLAGIKGVFAIATPSANVRAVLELSGIGSLIAKDAEPVQTALEQGETFESTNATYESFPLEKAGGMQLTVHGRPETLGQGRNRQDSALLRFDDNVLALGIGALGDDQKDNETRFGEFLAIGGVAAFQPSNETSRPDYVLSEGSLVPTGHLLLGLVGAGAFSHLIRFEARKETRVVGLTELAATILIQSKSPAAAFVAVTETSALVGASARKSFALAGGGDRFAFPDIRNWLAFTSERAHRDSTSLIVGVVAREGTSFQPLLRPLAPGLLGHFHAAAFPYGPLQKGRIDLKTTVASLFDTRVINAVLHLLSDTREFNGVGESEFLRGAIWIAPALNSDTLPSA